jgi:LysM repeat protein
MGSLPLVMTGTLATTVVAVPGVAEVSHSNQSGKAGEQAADQRPAFSDRLAGVMLPLAHSILSVARPDLPATYTVHAGDTISSIADAHGIPTPAILTLNGLSWNSVLHEGQILKLSAEPTKKVASSPARVVTGGYIVQNGETPSTIADRLGISTAALLDENGLDSSSTIYAGQMIRIPGSTAAVVERDAETLMPTIASSASVIPASLESDSAPAAETNSDGAEISEQEIFDAADIPVAEKPALITVKVATPKAPVVEKITTPTPAPKASTPDPEPVVAAETPAATSTTTTGQPVTGSITPLNDERRANAQIIVNVGRELGVPDYGIVIALATAMQESSLRNINWGDRDSVGLYQQRPSTGWGTVEQIMDQAYATRLFFGGPSNPNRGKTRGLLDIAGWENMALTDAAQRVQISAYPQAYAKWEPSAWAWLYELT